MDILSKKIEDVMRIINNNCDKKEKIDKLLNQVINELSKMPMKDAIKFLKDKDELIKVINNKYSCKSFVDVKKINSIEELNNIISLKKTKGKYYRGISNVNYNLISSYDRNRNEYSIHTFNKLLKEYVEINLKIYELMQNNAYMLCSFMQHYMELSPLIDITSDPSVALYFALNDKGLIAKPTNDIAIYEIFVSNENIVRNVNDADMLLRKYNVNIINENDYMEKSYLKEKSFEMKVIDIEDLSCKNDRQLIQDAAFLYLNTGFVVNSQIKMPTIASKDLYIRKNIISQKIIIKYFDVILKKLKKYIGIEDVKKYLEYHICEK